MPAEALALPVTEAVHHDELAVYALESRRCRSRTTSVLRDVL